MQTVKVVTLNIWNKSGPWPARLRLLQDELARAAPDVVGLQEVMCIAGDDEREPAGAVVSGAGALGDPSSDQLAELVGDAGWHVARAPAQHYGGGLVMGNALLSRAPILRHAGFRLPGTESGETRSLLFAEVDTKAGTLPVFVTHLNWKLHHGSVRVSQVRSIVERVFELAPVDERRLPPVLMGDFNAEPDSDEIRYLRGLHTIDGSSVYFADAWLYGGDGSTGATFDRANRFAALAHEYPRRIDYIFVRGPDRKYRGEPLTTRLVGTEPALVEGEPVWPSDHYGVETELAVALRAE